MEISGRSFDTQTFLSPPGCSVELRVGDGALPIAHRHVAAFIARTEIAHDRRVVNEPQFCIKVDGGRTQAHGLLDALALVDISNNIGDSRSLMTHPASTTHSGVAEEKRIEMGITENLLRINIGLEDPADVIDDLDCALQAVGL